VHNFIRGMSGHPGAATTLDSGTKLKLLRSLISDRHIAEPGRFEVVESKRLFVGTQSAALEVLELQREGKNAMAAEEFLRGSKSLFIRA
ncbi:MAG TPA: methionyl-tRNA formyltransferase, partial [Candidatus Kapabacteria bacterium]|nr:methionyl-tRNA formyltransferase [Candidatus Kapabacteria bacterium]